ncbi:hypothetical protein AJ85_07710 [Alkalihalobacillus alcalophilus ATCC 27647 = CGMCC 1.3604]|uniref:ABC-2 transporter permease n=1 Tax=Alkalihalobacillus alcalophilus ATCC 27647 = CGMCC 1.3604 TaxID=1218173 RepID=A0A094YT73_ALKAL|nr:ABC-2 transporter permease [Alkalihalobacillus alcalophilus]KGA96667.1 hypothetical protein BALCAV_0214930 [Alkalihalobacillus alcalophilus ATCC 27647 = CGMCC 1.3604]MED1561821.1 ABC-2 transporter permease [Alkalihalobacillus alcalophilus]THG91009.1 hypothetical protein AJ85_07710 [Alkalihalobacillus alcalophilus ATCC 27647 = CGMCC 1.3604]
MLNLLKKDLLLQKKQFIIYPIILGAYIYAGLHPYFIFMVISTIFITSSFYNDEKDKAHLLLNSMPYTRKEIVSSKYVSALLFPILVIPVCYIGQQFVSYNQMLLDFRTIIFSFVMIILFSAATMPLCFKFTHRQLTVAGVVLFVGIFAIAEFLPAATITSILDGISFLIKMSAIELFTIIVPLSVLVYFISWLLSIRIYQRRML